MRLRLAPSKALKPRSRRLSPPPPGDLCSPTLARSACLLRFQGSLLPGAVRCNRKSTITGERVGKIPVGLLRNRLLLDGSYKISSCSLLQSTTDVTLPDRNPLHPYLLRLRSGSPISEPLSQPPLLAYHHPSPSLFRGAPNFSPPETLSSSDLRLRFLSQNLPRNQRLDNNTAQPRQLLNRLQLHFNSTPNPALLQSNPVLATHAHTHTHTLHSNQLQPTRLYSIPLQSPRRPNPQGTRGSESISR